MKKYLFYYVLFVSLLAFPQKSIANINETKVFPVNVSYSYPNGIIILDLSVEMNIVQGQLTGITICFGNDRIPFTDLSGGDEEQIFNRINNLIYHLICERYRDAYDINVIWSNRDHTIFVNYIRLYWTNLP